MTTFPSLRPDVRLEADESQPRPSWVVIDEALGRRIRVDEGTAALLQALDAPRGVADLAARAGLDEETTARMARRVADLQLLDDPTSRAIAEDSERARWFQHAGREEAPLLIREDARFTCTMCGSCCGSQNIGPVMDDVVEGLRPHLDALEAETGSAKGLFFEVGAGDRAEPGKHVLCHSSDGACVFLDEEGLCRIHRAHGGDAKPRVCRLFPYEFMATPDGVAVSLSMECRGYPEARGGKRLVDREGELRELVALAPQLHRVRPVVSLDGARTVTWSDYRALEDALHAIVDEEGDDPARTLLAMRRALRDLCGTEPEPATESLDDLREDLDAFTGALASNLEELREMFTGQRQGVVLHAEALDGIIDALGHLRADFHRIVRPPRRPGERALFRDQMHNLLVQKKLTEPPTVVRGLSRLTLRWLLTHGLAIHRARQVRRRHLVPQDLMDATVTLGYVFRTRDLQGLLEERFDEAIADLFHARLPALLEHAAELPDPDRDTHIYKF